jgi:hypothetical protein
MVAGEGEHGRDERRAGNENASDAYPVHRAAERRKAGGGLRGRALSEDDALPGMVLTSCGTSVLVCGTALLVRGTALLVRGGSGVRTPV